MKFKSSKFILCGKIGRPFGVKGELTVFWHNLVAPIKVGEKLYLQAAATPKSLTLLASRRQAERSIVRFAEVNDREAAQTLSNQDLWLPETALQQLPAHEYYAYQLLDMQVYDEAGNLLGKLVNIFSTVSNDVYEILPPGKKAGEELAIPAVSNVIQKIDLAHKTMTIRALPGLFSDEEEHEI